MSMVKDIETKLAGVFKGLPPISEGGKKTLVGVWPWLALIFGVLQLLAALGLWRVIRATTVLNDYVNSYYQQVTGRSVGLSGFDKGLLYLGVIFLIVDAVILLMAFPKLQQRAKAGWDLLFLGSLLNVVYAVLSLFMHGRGLTSFLASLVGSAVGFYLLFQVRDKFGGSSAAPKSDTSPPAAPPVAG